MHFDSPCTAVERVWFGRRCILRPGADSDCYEFSTLGNKLKKYKIMLDYEDFNSAHTLTAQKIVVELLFAGLDQEWHNWLIASFDNMRVKDVGGAWHDVKGTLMSGHRMTSILNTILNAAYLRLILGESVYNSCDFRHVGDNVLATCDDPITATYVVQLALSSQLRFQKNKQRGD